MFLNIWDSLLLPHTSEPPVSISYYVPKTSISIYDQRPIAFCALRKQNWTKNNTYTIQFKVFFRVINIFIPI